MMQVRLEGVSKSYGDLPVLTSVDLTIAPGEFVALLGPSGSGKSTLLHVIGGLDRADSGRVGVGGRDLQSLSDAELARYRNGEVGVVFQFFNLFPSLTVLDNVSIPGVLRRLPADEIRRRALDLLDRVGLRALAAKRANELSGGELQRVALCRALSLRPPLLLADEPTGNLDSANGERVMGLLSGLAREQGATVVMVTHDEALAARASRTVRLKDGRVAP
jgi:putative ABC transport system ATP-binding protein